MHKETSTKETTVIGKTPYAVATVKGSEKFPSIIGRVSFFSMKNGTLVTAQVAGLPNTNSGAKTLPEGKMEKCSGDGIFGFHIHSGSSCTGTAENPFANAGSHFDKNKCPHPYHSGDLPPLFGNEGYALSAFYTDRFKPGDVINHTVIIHALPDDFTTQPSGATGEMMACGEINAI